ncbi:MAG: BMP family lipoprotein [Candidatus Kariarchaeaceae archaeon]|jgi:basic membrane protein A
MLLVVTFQLLLISSLINTSPTSGAAKPDAKIAIVFSTGGLGDQSFNDAANVGKIRAIAANPGITVDQFEPSDITGINTQIEAYSAASVYDLIIAVGFTATDGVNASAIAHPTQKYLIIDSVVDLPNVASVVFKEHEGSFLAGAMAAMVSENDDIAFLGGLDIPLINKFLAGYRQGARYINPDIVVRHTYSPDPTNPWGDLAGGKVVAETFIEQGSDVIYAAAGGTGIGVITAASQATEDHKIYAIGVDSNQDHLQEGYVLTSMIKRVDVAVETQIQAIVDGTWTPRFFELGIKEDGVGITNMIFTQTEANALYESGVTRMEKINLITANINGGTIFVASELDPKFDPLTGEVQADAKIALVFSTGGLGDQSFNDAANEGKNRAIANNPGISVNQFEPSDITGINTQIEAYSAYGGYDLIIAVGFTATDGVTASATVHPDQQFIIIDSVVDLPNVASVVFSEHEGSFLVGAMAAMVSENDDIAFLGGLDIPLINKFLAGYRQGARYINPDITVRHTYSPDPNNPWGDLYGGKAVAEIFIEQGSDVIYAAAGGTGIGVMTAASQATKDHKIYAIGVDSNQDHLQEGYVLTSMIKRVDVAVETQIQAIVDGTWTAGVTELTLEKNGVGITNMIYTQTEANTEYETGVTRMEKIALITADINDGTIVVASELDPNFDPLTPTTTSSASDSSVTRGTSTATTPSIPLNNWASIVGLMVVPIIGKRIKH